MGWFWIELFKITLFDNVVIPDTLNDEFNATKLLKLEFPLTFKIPLIVVLFDKVVLPEIFNDPTEKILPPLDMLLEIETEPWLKTIVLLAVVLLKFKISSNSIHKFPSGL